MKPIQRLITCLFNEPLTAPRSAVIMRLMVGGVFLSEGILKFVYPNQGIGRFTKLEIPAPELTATFVGGLEIVVGILLIVGLFTRVIAIPFIIEMVVAILTTKIALDLGRSPLPLPPALPKVGFWAVMHETRSDYAQIHLTAHFESCLTCWRLLTSASSRAGCTRVLPGFREVACELTEAVWRLIRPIALRTVEPSGPGRRWYEGWRTAQGRSSECRAPCETSRGRRARA